MFVFVSLRFCSSHLLVLSATTSFMVRVLVSFAPYPISEFFRFFSFSFFFVALISRVAFFCCALVPGTLALDLPTLILLRRLVFLCFIVCDHKFWICTWYFSRMEESGRTLGVLLMMLGRKNGLMWKQQQVKMDGPTSTLSRYVWYVNNNQNRTYFIYVLEVIKNFRCQYFVQGRTKTGVHPPPKHGEKAGTRLFAAAMFSIYLYCTCVRRHQSNGPARYLLPRYAAAHMFTTTSEQPNAQPLVVQALSSPKSQTYVRVTSAHRECVVYPRRAS